MKEKSQVPGVDEFSVIPYKLAHDREALRKHAATLSPEQRALVFSIGEMAALDRVRAQRRATHAIRGAVFTARAARQVCRAAHSNRRGSSRRPSGRRSSRTVAARRARSSPLGEPGGDEPPSPEHHLHLAPAALFAVGGAR